MLNFQLILLLLIIVQSGTILFYGLPIAALLPIVLVQSFITVFFSYFRLRRILFIFIALVSVHLFQNLTFNGIIKADILSVLNYLTIVLVLFIIDVAFVKLYTRVIIFLTAISLIVYVLLQLFPNIFWSFESTANLLPEYSGQSDFYNIHGGKKNSFHLWFYHFPMDQFALLRNYGIFFEPGRFAIFLILGIIFTLFIEKYKITNWRVILLILGLISTFSTAGYSAMIIIFYVYYQVRIKNIYLKIAFLIVGSVMTVYLLSFDFMFDKINDQISSTHESSRFYAIFYHWNYIKEHFLLGYGNNMPKLKLSPNGITLLLMKHGILLTIFLFYGLNNFFKSLLRSNSGLGNIYLLLTISFVLTCFSQTITIEPFFYFLSFSGFFVNS